MSKAGELLEKMNELEVDEIYELQGKYVQDRYQSRDHTTSVGVTGSFSITPTIYSVSEGNTGATIIVAAVKNITFKNNYKQVLIKMKDGSTHEIRVVRSV